MIRTRSDRRVVYVVLLLMAAGTAAVVALLEDYPRVETLRRFYGVQMYLQLWLILMASPLAYFHSGRWASGPLRIRAALGNATVFPALAHLMALLFLPPIYLLNLGNPFDITGTAGSLVIVILAATSFEGPRKRLGARTWKRVHRWLYVGFAVTTPAALFGGVMHVRPPVLALIVVLVGYRLAWMIVRRRRGQVPKMARFDRLHGVAMALTTWAILILSSPDQVENAHGGEDDPMAYEGPPGDHEPPPNP